MPAALAPDLSALDALAPSLGARLRAPEREPGWPLPPPLAPLLPEGTLRRGTTLRISRSTTLLLTLLGEASRGGAWCAAVGTPSLGVLAAAQAGVDLDRFALVPAPGASWSTVTAALLDAIDVVVIAPPTPATASLARRLSARARERRAVLLVVGPWEGADADLSVVGRQWEGVGAGHGHLQSRRLDVQASGRRIGGRPRTAQLRLTSSGRVCAAPVVGTVPLSPDPGELASIPASGPSSLEHRHDA